MGNYGGYAQLAGAIIGAYGSIKGTNANIKAMKQRNNEVLREMNSQVQNVMANIGIQRMNTNIALQQIRTQKNSVLASTDNELAAAGMIGSSYDNLRSNLLKNAEEEGSRAVQNYITTAMNLKDQAKGITNSALNASNTQVQAVPNTLGTADYSGLGKALEMGVQAYQGSKGSSTGSSAWTGTVAGDESFGGQMLSGQLGMYSRWLNSSSKTAGFSYFGSDSTASALSQYLGV